MESVIERANEYKQRITDEITDWLDSYCLVTNYEVSGYYWRLVLPVNQQAISLQQGVVTLIRL